MSAPGPEARRVGQRVQDAVRRATGVGRPDLDSWCGIVRRPAYRRYAKHDLFEDIAARVAPRRELSGLQKVGGTSSPVRRLALVADQGRRLRQRRARRQGGQEHEDQRRREGARRRRARLREHGLPAASRRLNGCRREARRQPHGARSGKGGRRLGSARLGSARSARLGSARLGSLGSARLGSARLGSARLGSARLGSAGLGSAKIVTRAREGRVNPLGGVPASNLILGAPPNLPCGALASVRA